MLGIERAAVRGWVAWSIVLGLLAWGTPVPAQDAAPSAQVLFETGLAAAKRGDLEAAAELFARSDGLERSPNTLLNLAITYGRLNRALDALDTLDRLEELVQSEPDGVRRAKMDKLRAQVQGQVARFELVVTPVDARITVDGLPMPKNHRLAPGEHLIRVEADGFQPASWTIRLAAGDAQREERSLAPMVVAPLAQPPLALAATGVEPRGPVAPRAAPAPAPAPASPENGRRRRRRALLIASAAVVAIAGSVIAVALTTGDADEPAVPPGETPFRALRENRAELAAPSAP